MKTVHIRDRQIGPGFPAFIVAELSANHCGSLDQAKVLIQAARECGADAVKLQTYRADTITINCEKPDFIIPSDNPWTCHNTLFSLYEKAFTPWEWHDPLMELALGLELEFFSSPFDSSAVDFLESLGAPAYKIASPEITDVPLLKRVAKTGKPVIVSTGIARLADIELAVETLCNSGCEDMMLLKCASSYPADPEEINLRTIPHMAEMFDCVAGLSDHTPGIGVPVAAVAVGARIIEKHLVLSRNDPSPDAFFSLEPAEFERMVTEIRRVEKALGGVSYELTPKVLKNRWGRRSLYIAKKIGSGETLTYDHVKSIRPGFGLHPKHLDDIIGRQVTRDLEPGDRLSWDVVGTH